MRWQPLAMTARRWVDSYAGVEEIQDEGRKVDWLRVLPLILLHLSCLAVIWVGWSPTAVAVAVALYLVRMFAVTGFYHRYFSHKSFKTGRWTQLAFAILGTSAIQRGPLWWSAHHRHHHAHADREDDVHSPSRHGFLWSHLGWLTSKANFPTRHKLVPDLARYPELVFLDRFDKLVPLALAAALYTLGETLKSLAPGLGTSGPQLLVWGFSISSIVLLHATLCINSVAHRVGWRRYATKDDSRNSLLLALLTLGEGWHNNHHHYPASTRQGFFWWEIDVTFYLLLVLSWLGLIRDLKPVPARCVRTQPTGVD